ncbi:hypothetical protein [Streptomyces luteolus]|uniref:Tyr recombinase domain-containing protein n=1 Tax=Streptomyces luteolus TaxID=3043615 RepID=A0ABT6T597_9ACTN|nr:hypothetical protein [Streptomyces sp. B-S-A12]MDI3422806.1 hypothetical protein [Streptomyces sp. B-S-A12]
MTTVDVPDELFEALWEFADGNPGALWPGTTGIKVSSEISLLAAQVGVPMQCHQLRHTAITRYYQRSQDLIAT